MNNIEEKIAAIIKEESGEKPQNKFEPQKVQWEKAIEFEENGVVASVSVLPITRPRYSVEIGTKTNAGRFGRYLPLFVEGRGKVEVRRIDRETIDRLLTQAEDYVRMKVQENEDAFIEFKLAQEKKREAQQQKGEHQPKPGLKTLAKKDKQKKGEV